MSLQTFLKDRETFDFQDLLIKPSEISKVISRKNVNLSSEEFDGVPIFASNMMGVGTFEVAKVLQTFGAFTCIQKSYEVEDWLKFVNVVEPHFTVPTVGATNDDFKKFKKLVVALQKKDWMPSHVCFDVANGHTVDNIQRAIEVHKFIKDVGWEETDFIYGNVANPNIISILLEEYNWLPNTLKVGIGSGSVCFRKGTLVKTNTGLKKIEDIKTGEEVLTHTGTYKKVLNNFVNETERLININGITCTPSHKFYVVNKCDVSLITEKNLENYAFWLEAEKINENKHLLIKR